MIQWDSTPARSISDRCNDANESSPTFPTYRAFRPHAAHATMALATWPPGRTSELRNSTLELNAGKWGRRIIVSVAFSPTPAISTIGNASSIETLYEKTTRKQEKNAERNV